MDELKSSINSEKVLFIKIAALLINDIN